MSNFEKNKDTQEENNITAISADFSVEGQELNNTTDVADASTGASPDVYVHKFSKPKKYNGKEITEITFNWGDVTCAEALAIEAEMLASGKLLAMPQFSGDFIFRMASRASAPRVGIDFFESNALSISDYNRIRSAARTFLLQSE